MAIINIDTGSAQQAVRIADAFADVYGWTPKVVDPQNPEQHIDNPVSKGQFVKQQLVSFIKQTVTASEANKAADQARKAAADSVNQLTVS